VQGASREQCSWWLYCYYPGYYHIIRIFTVISATIPVLVSPTSVRTLVGFSSASRGAQMEVGVNRGTIGSYVSSYPTLVACGICPSVCVGNLFPLQERMGPLDQYLRQPLQLQ
jgi:hypothetical protein